MRVDITCPAETGVRARTVTPAAFTVTSTFSRRNQRVRAAQ